MKKQIMASILVGVMAIGMAVPSFAVSDTTYISATGDNLCARGGTNTKGAFGRAYTADTRMTTISADLTAVMEDQQTRTDKDTRRNAYEAYALVSTSKRVNSGKVTATGTYNGTRYTAQQRFYR